MKKETENADENVRNTSFNAVIPQNLPMIVTEKPDDAKEKESTSRIKSLDRWRFDKKKLPPLEFEASITAVESTDIITGLESAGLIVAVESTDSTTALEPTELTTAFESSKQLNSHQ